MHPLPSVITSNLSNLPYPIFQPVPRDSLGERWLETHAGPTRSSNWLVPHQLLVSVNPVRLSDEELETLIRDSGITLWVNLLPVEVRTSYEERVRLIVHKLPARRECSFFSRGIEDLLAPSVEVARTIVDVIVSEIRQEEGGGGVVALHCRGGCGRAGTIGTCVLAELFPEMLLSEALGRCQASHNSRLCYAERKAFLPSPETHVQRLLVAEFFGSERCDIASLMPGMGELRKDPVMPSPMPHSGRLYCIRTKVNDHVLAIRREDVPEGQGERRQLKLGIPLRFLPKREEADLRGEQTFHAALNTDDGTWSFRNLRTGLMIDIQGRESGWSYLQLWLPDGSSAQRFYISPREISQGGGWTITAQCSQRCFDVPHSAKEFGSIVLQWGANLKDAQVWFFDEVVGDV